MHCLQGWLLNAYGNLSITLHHLVWYLLYCCKQKRVPKQRRWHFARFLVKEWSVAPSILKWEWSRAEANASDRSIEEIVCWCDYSHYCPWVPRGYRSSDDGILTPILGGKWFVAPSMLKWEWTSAEANASNRPIDEIGCWRVPSHFRIWVPRGYGSSGDGHCSFLKATPRESKRRRRGEVDRTCHLPENLVFLVYK